MLTEIRLENFKCFGKPTAIPLGPISVFIGPNGSGKSSPIQAMMLLKQSLGDEKLNLSGPYLEVGQPADIAFRGDAEVPVMLGYSGPGFSYDVTFQEGAVRKAQLDASVGQRRIKGSHGLPKGPQDPIESISPHIARPFELSITINIVGPEGVVEELGSGGVNELLEEVLQNLWWVPPWRGFTRYSYQLEAKAETNFGTWNMGQDPGKLATTLKYREEEVEKKLSDWYYRVTQIKVRFALRAEMRTFVQSVTDSGSFNIVHEGFGSNQLAFLLGPLAFAAETSTIAIEEPEIHLHPKAQFELADVLREVAKAEDKQLIITTHSEHILLRFLTSVAAGELNPDDLVVNYFEKKDGITEVRRLEIDEKGRVKGGLPGFFEAELAELDSYVKAVFREP